MKGCRGGGVSGGGGCVGGCDGGCSGSGSNYGFARLFYFWEIISTIK